MGKSRIWKTKRFISSPILLDEVLELIEKYVKYFKKEDLPKLVEFHKALNTTHRGCMSEYNAAYQWGDNGTRALKNKNLDPDEVRGRLR